MFVNLETVRLLSPELILILAATFICVGGAFVRHRALWSVVALGALVVAGYDLSLSTAKFEGTLAGPVIMDGLAITLRWLLVTAGIFFVSLAWQSASRELFTEYVGLLLFALVGAMLTVSAGDMIMLFLGLELISIPTYVLLFIGRRDRDSAEAAGKYFFLSILSSALLLYGLSFLYGLGGTTAFLGSESQPGLRSILLNYAGSPLASLAPLALLLILVGLGFKLAAVPFHFYAPDVYQGATPANAALLAILPKIAASVGIVRLIMLCLPWEAERAWQLLFIMALFSMTIGNVCALWQKNLQRMFAYSSIAHSGYLLIGLAVAQAAITSNAPHLHAGLTGVVFYLVVYTFATLGSFAALTVLSSSGREIRGVDDLAGSGASQPLPAAALAIFMFSLAGIPPLAGFWGKFTLFNGAIGLAMQTTGAASLWFIGLAICGALNAAIGAAYYLRVVGVMYFQPAASEQRTPMALGGALSATLACACVVILVGVSPGFVMRGAATAEQHVQQELKQSFVSTMKVKPLAKAE